MTAEPQKKQPRSTRGLLLPAALPFLFLGSSTVGLANSETDARWARVLDDPWCLLFDASKICLPNEYRVKYFDHGLARFRVTSAEARPLIDYESSRSRTPSEFIDSLHDDSRLVVGNTQHHDGLTITEVAGPASSSDESLGVTVFILNFDDQFMLKIYGGNREANEKLARDLFAQWSATENKN